MRLIDADALVNTLKGLRALTNILSGSRERPLIPFDDMVRMIEKSPTIEEQKWIPCSDAPDTDRNVFIARGERDCMSVCIGHYSNEYKQWYEDRNWFGLILHDGLYWCEMPPLPEPYMEEGEQDG